MLSASAFILSVILAARREAPVPTFTATTPVVLANDGGCTPMRCATACAEYINNRWCLMFNATCRSDGSCFCEPMCFIPGQKPHIEMQPVDSCETRTDSCE